jgi:hypothetical protein
MDTHMQLAVVGRRRVRLTPVVHANVSNREDSKPYLGHDRLPEDMSGIDQTPDPSSASPTRPLDPGHTPDISKIPEL